MYILYCYMYYVVFVLISFYCKINLVFYHFKNYKYKIKYVYDCYIIKMTD